MNRKALPYSRPHIAGGLFCGLLLIAGCGGSQFGGELSARPEPRPIVGPETSTLRLPADEPFSIVLPRSSKAAGLDGAADADATANDRGQAQAAASVTNSGTAEALFQLGHGFVNDTGRQIDLDFNVQYHYDFGTEQPADSNLPDAAIGLRLYAREARGALLRDIGLVDHTTERGATQRAGDEKLAFSLTLGPGRSVDVYLAGRAKVDIPDGRTAAARLELSDLRFEVVSKPAPAVRTAGDERK